MKYQELINQAISKGAVTYANLSGGKDGQAMLKAVIEAGIPVEGIIHCDLGRTEWPQSMQMCERSAAEYSLPLHIVKRTDGVDMLGHWENRMKKLEGSGKPFWSSSKNRYCTSDMKRDPTNRFYNNCDHDFVISMEGIRAQESPARSKKSPFEIRDRITSTYYDGMTPAEAIANYKPGKRLAITWYPIFEYSLEEVLNTYGMSIEKMEEARRIYRKTKQVPSWWPFHAAYAMGNNRVSCMFCIMGSLGDLENAAEQNPTLLKMMIALEEAGKATFQKNWSLKELEKKSP
jgi:3'-phosphoadenosine 5'-phosphosulfate sulfotransferase (PAPS reductase)/FAD synthetase